MRVSYYPGCSLEATARDYQESLAYVCKQLGIELEEIPDWSCCGATAAHSTDEFLSLAFPPGIWPWPNRSAWIWSSLPHVF